MSIISNTTDLEQQCEDSLFEVCDSRERYPQQCATELEKCIKLTNKIHVGLFYIMIINSFCLFII